MTTQPQILADIIAEYPSIDSGHMFPTTPQTVMVDEETSLPVSEGYNNSANLLVWQDGFTFTFTITDQDIAYVFSVMNVTKNRASIIAGVVMMEFVLALGYSSLFMFTDVVGSGSLRYQLGSGFKGAFDDRKARQWKTKGHKLLVDSEWLARADEVMSKFDYVLIEHTGLYGRYMKR